MIPVPTDSPVNSGGSDARRSHSLDVPYYDAPSLLPSNDTSTGSSTITASSSMASCKSEPLDPDPDEDIENFLSKVDSAIAVTKKSVEQTRKQSDILAKIQEGSDYEQSDDYTTSSFSNPGYDGNCNTNGTSSSGGGTTYAGTRRKVAYEGAYQSLDGDTTRRSNSRRHIKNSMHRLEKQQDDLFEL